MQRLLRDSAYTLTALPIGILTFAIAVTGLSAGAGLLIVWIGLPVLVGTVLLSRAFAHLERLRLRSLQGPRGPAAGVPEGGGGVERPPSTAHPAARPSVVAGHVLGDRRVRDRSDRFRRDRHLVGGRGRWTDLLVLAAVDPESETSTTLPELIGLGDGRDAEIWLNLGIGAFALLTLPWVVRTVALLHAGTADAMLNGRERLARD